MENKPQTISLSAGNKARNNKANRYLTQRRYNIISKAGTGDSNHRIFICLGDQPGFDYEGENNTDKQGYAAFGKVIKGMDIVKQFITGVKMTRLLHLRLLSLI